MLGILEMGVNDMDFEATEDEEITLSRRVGSASLLFFTLS